MTVILLSSDFPTGVGVSAGWPFCYENAFNGIKAKTLPKE